VQTGIVLIASLYLWFFASMIDLAAADNPAIFGSSRAQALSTEGTTLAVVQLLSCVLLVAAGVRALSARTRAAWLLTAGAHAAQLALALYWTVRLVSLTNEVPGADGGPVAFTVFFAAAPAVGLGMVVVGPGRRWFDGPHHP
jgi:hypothetical protein